mgnify:CR=1 FL=1
MSNTATCGTSGSASRAHPLASHAAASGSGARSLSPGTAATQAAAAQGDKTGKGASVEVTFTQEELTSKANGAGSTLTDSGLAIADTQVHLAGGNIVATSSVTFQGFSLNVGVVATPIVVNGQTQIVIKEIQTGALPIPDAIKQQLNAQLGQVSDPKKLGLPIDVSNLTVVDGKLVVKGQAKP